MDGEGEGGEIGGLDRSDSICCYLPYLALATYLPYLGTTCILPHLTSLCCLPLSFSCYLRKAPGHLHLYLHRLRDCHEEEMSDPVIGHPP